MVFTILWWLTKIYNLNAETNQKIRPTYWKKTAIKQTLSKCMYHAKLDFLAKLCWNNNVKLVFVKFEEIISSFNQLQKNCTHFRMLFGEVCWVLSILELQFV